MIIIGATRSFQAAAQQAPSGYQVLYKDSVVLEETSSILNLLVRIENNGQHSLQLNYSINLPKGWKQLNSINAGNDSLLTVSAGGSTPIVLNLLKTPRLRAGWDSVKISVWDAQHPDTISKYIRVAIRARPDYLFKLISEDQSLVGEKPDQLTVSAYIRNTGNTHDTYQLTCNNNFFNISYNAAIMLGEGRDTTLRLSFPLKNDAWRNLYSESLYFSTVSAKNGKAITRQFKLTKPQSTVAQNKSSIIGWPITIGGGLMSMGKDISYFGQMSGQISGGNHRLSFNYRSMNYGDVANAYQPNLFSLVYDYRNFQLAAGQVTLPKNFFTNGQGISAGYYGRKGFSISASATRYLEQPGAYNYRSNNVYGRIAYTTKKLSITHLYESNYDLYYKINSYLVENEVMLTKTKDFKLKAFFGAGYEKKLGNVTNTLPATGGLAGGYDFRYSKKGVNLISTIRFYSGDFPGIYKGYRNQQHDLFYVLGKSRIGLAFTSNAISRNTLRDTLYNTDYLASNNTKYGITLGHITKASAVNFRTGVLRSIGLGSNLDKALYVDADIKLNLGKYSYFALSSNNAVKPQPTGAGVYVTNSYASIISRFVEFTGSYNRLPVFSDNLSVASYTETVNAGPAVNFGFFKNALTGSLRYSIAKTLSEDQLRNGVGGQVNYRNKNGNLTVGVSGFYPLKDPTKITLPVAERRYGTVYMYKRINIPVRKLKYYSLAVTLFEDRNNNGLLDDAEPLLTNTVAEVDGKQLVTDATGTIRYTKVTPGAYKIALLDTRLEALIPTNGVLQSVDLQANTQMLIPFRKGRKISGNLKIEHDSLSVTVLTPGNFRIIFTDTAGKTYNTLTNPNGDFYTFVPEGVYSVSLNPDAFEGSDFKPQQISFTADLITEKSAVIQFLVKQKRRKIRFLETSAPATKTTKGK